MLKQEQKLRHIIKDMGSAVIAFSGGVDSSLLLKLAFDILGEKTAGVTAISPTYQKHEIEEAEKLASFIGVKHIVIKSNELDDENFTKNDNKRCYYCKDELYSLLETISNKQGFECVADGTNHDDISDYRPGRNAASEHRVRSPFIEAGINKKTIRNLARKYKLPNWNKPAQACLSSRFPYGTNITEERLEQVYAGELVLKNAGFTGFRLRFHNDIARLELSPDEFDKAIQLRNTISEKLKKLGFTYISLDLDGYRTGAMNETIGK